MYSLRLQYPKGINHPPGYDTDTAPFPHTILLIFYVVLRLRGSGYPQYILTKAAELNDDTETIENKFYPLYDKILHYWFPPAEGYDVCPKWSIPDYRKTEDFTISYVIKHKGRPLLLIEIKPPSDFDMNSGRAAAIAQVTGRLDEIGPTNQDLERLYAISAIGKRWRACYTSKGKCSKGGKPVKGIAEVSSLRSANQRCWNADITSDASWAALQNIVETVKSYLP